MSPNGTLRFGDNNVPLVSFNAGATIGSGVPLAATELQESYPDWVCANVAATKYQSIKQTQPTTPLPTLK